MTPTVLIASDDEALRSLLRRLLGEAVSLLGEAATGEEALRLALSLRPNVVLMDIALPGLDGVAATGRVKAEDPQIRVVLLTGYEKAYLDATGKSGADVLLPKRDVRTEVLSAVRALGPHWDGRDRRRLRPAALRAWPGRDRRQAS